MQTYYIHESNMERLQKKMATVSKKCAQSHCSFTYNVVNTVYRDCEDESGKPYVAKYFEVEVDGTARYEGWRFVATLDHHDEGNVIRAFDTELVIPEKYKKCGPTCEHCNKIRSRKDTYLIYNEDTQEFKQVGKSCLKEFTNGLSAEDIAFFVSIYEGFEAGFGYSGYNYNMYIEVKAILRYAFECYKHWGYQRTYQDEDNYNPNYRSTRDRVTDYFWIERALGKRREELQDEMDSVGFNAGSEYAVSTTDAALDWIRNISEDELARNEYLRNLHVICSDEYTEYRSLGILVSLTTAWDRHLGKIAAYEKKQKELNEQKVASGYVGNVGERIDINVKTFQCVSSWENQFGMTFLYKFTDEQNNIFVWYASSGVEDEENVRSIKGTVKDHSEYQGVKQTVLTRCKVTSWAKKEKATECANDDVYKAVAEFLDYCNA